jgi:hypothetical protein
MNIEVGRLQVNDEYELWSTYRDSKEKRKKHGFLFYEFLKAEKEGFEEMTIEELQHEFQASEGININDYAEFLKKYNDRWKAKKGAFKKWKAKYGINDDIYLLKNEAENIKMFFDMLDSPVDRYREVAEKWFVNKIGNLSFVGLNNTAFTVTSDSILSLIAHEIIELQKIGRKFCKCKCGLWYVKKSDQRANYCPDCPPPSKQKGYKLLENNDRTYRCRLRQAINAGKITREEAIKKANIHTEKNMDLRDFDKWLYNKKI